KIAVTGAPNDRAAVKVHDIGIRMHRNAAGEAGFEIIVGGGLGRTPMIGKTIREFLPKRHLLSYLEAILRVYNEVWRPRNLFKSRIKILVHEIGAAEMTRRVEEEWAQIRGGALDLPIETIAGIAAQFSPPAYAPQPAAVPEIDTLRFAEPGFARWLKTNVAKHSEAA